MTHELSLIKDLLRKIESIAKEHDSKKVIGVSLKLGALAHISAGHLREHFEEAVSGTALQGVQLDITVSKNETDPHAQDIMLESVEVET